MANPKPLTDKDGEVRELTAQDMAGFKSIDTLPKSLQAKLRGRGPQKAPTKTRITIRLSSEVVEGFRATGTGWQVRMDEALKGWLARHS
jgi:uncharacterized protein (DUF4415 family)